MGFFNKGISVFNNQTPGSLLKSSNVPDQVKDCVEKCNIDPEKVVGYQVTTSKGVLSALFGFVSKKSERTQVSVTTIENGVKQTYTRNYTPNSP